MLDYVRVINFRIIIIIIIISKNFDIFDISKFSIYRPIFGTHTARGATRPVPLRHRALGIQLCSALIELLLSSIRAKRRVFLPLRSASFRVMPR